MPSAVTQLAQAEENLRRLNDEAALAALSLETALRKPEMVRLNLRRAPLAEAAVALLGVGAFLWRRHACDKLLNLIFM